MRWIDRGPEPAQVQEYAQKYTHGWVKYSRDGDGARPVDSYWREFRSKLGERSADMCWYCERPCVQTTESKDLAATLDHFRPLSRFPDLSYDWSNWVFSCRRCNVVNKQDRWPKNGYVDPAAGDEMERPERYFDYDAKTAEIIPRNGLSEDKRCRAWNTIDDLGLNKIDVRVYRQRWMQQLVEDLREFPADERVAFVEYLARHPSEFLRLTLMVLEQLREASETPQSPSP